MHVERVEAAEIEPWCCNLQNHLCVLYGEQS